METALNSAGDVEFAATAEYHPVSYTHLTSALDPGSTMKVEELMSALKKNYTEMYIRDR